MGPVRVYRSGLSSAVSPGGKCERGTAASAARWAVARRQELQNEEDLHQALVQGNISGAALDVFQEEPIAEDSPLRKLENVILTPHSAPSRESYPRAVKHAVANLFRLQNNEPLLRLALDHGARARTFQNQHPEVDLMIPNE